MRVVSAPQTQGADVSHFDRTLAEYERIWINGSVHVEARQRQHTGCILIFVTSWVYDLSYKQLPSRFPKLRRVRLTASVTASFLHYMRIRT